MLIYNIGFSQAQYLQDGFRYFSPLNLVELKGQSIPQNNGSSVELEE